jgi:hypothetical protein
MRRFLIALFILAPIAGAHAECISQTAYQAQHTALEAQNVARRAAALAKAGLTEVPRRPVQIAPPEAPAVQWQAREIQGQLKVLVRAMRDHGLGGPALRAVLVGKTSTGLLSPLTVVAEPTTLESVVICGARACVPGRGTPMDVSQYWGALALEAGERWSPVERKVVYSQTLLQATYQRAAHCPPVP